MIILDFNGHTEVVWESPSFPFSWTPLFFFIFARPIFPAGLCKSLVSSITQPRLCFLRFSKPAPKELIPDASPYLCFFLHLGLDPLTELSAFSLRLLSAYFDLFFDFDWKGQLPDMLRESLFIFINSNWKYKLKCCKKNFSFPSSSLSTPSAPDRPSGSPSPEVQLIPVNTRFDLN